MRLKTVLLASSVVLAAGACSGGFDPFTAAGAAPSQVPAYEVISEDADSGGVARMGAELVVADATAGTARAAIADYVAEHTDRDYVDVSVLRSPDTATVVCVGRYVTSERVAEALTDIRADSYPALDVACPDPA